MTEIYDCKDVKALLSGLLDDEVDAPTRRLAERHLADCSECRNLLDEAEAVHDLLTLQTQQALSAATTLPAGFEQAVLRQTVYAEAYHFAGRRWTSWLGWVAAAASLLLATSLWMVDRQRVGEQIAKRETPAPPPTSFNQSSSASALNPQSVRHVAYATDRLAKSSVLEEGAYSISPVAQKVSEPSAAARSDEESQAVRSTPAALIAASKRNTISRDDAETLYAAAILLQMLDQSRLESFADVDHIRQIAEYDNVLERLAETRSRLSPSDVPAVLASETILLRIVQGPLNLDDVKFMHNTAAALDLPEQLSAMSNRWETAPTL